MGFAHENKECSDVLTYFRIGKLFLATLKKGKVMTSRNNILLLTLTLKTAVLDVE